MSNQKNVKSKDPVTVTIDKLVHGGQAMGTLEDGRKIFAWNALPGEKVVAEITRARKDYVEGFAIEVLDASPERIGFLDRGDINLSIAPWSIMTEAAERTYKAKILHETFLREGLEVDLPPMNEEPADDGRYRNKVEFSFWGDDDGLYFAHYLRASHQKIKLEYPYNDLIPTQMSDVAKGILEALNEASVRAGDLKSLVLRCSRGSDGAPKVVAALFVKNRDFPLLTLQDLTVIYSNPKSPASVKTKVLYTKGDIKLTDSILGKNITYDVFSFFQVNLPVFELALKKINELAADLPKIDMYAGVGTIGIPLGSTDILVELDTDNVRMAKENVGELPMQVVHASSEAALEYIDSKHCLIVDPPRAGLHKDVTWRIVDAKPPKVVYLSCNPSTQARDVRTLVENGYKVTHIEGFNFFPRTPHIESLVVLELA